MRKAYGRTPTFVKCQAPFTHAKISSIDLVPSASLNLKVCLLEQQQRMDVDAISEVYSSVSQTFAIMIAKAIVLVVNILDFATCFSQSTIGYVIQRFRRKMRRPTALTGRIDPLLYN